MQDMTAHLEKLRKLVAECELIRDLATDKAKREPFDRLAKRFRGAGRRDRARIAEAKTA